MSVAQSLPAPEMVPGFLYTCRLAPDGSFTFHAPLGEMERLLEVTPTEAETMLNTNQFPTLPDAAPDMLATVRESAANLTPWIRDLRVIAPRTNRELWVRVHGVPRREADGAVVWTGLVIDVTDLQVARQQLSAAAEELARTAALDQQLLDAQKWESLGVLAGGVAHDFNNILTVVMGSAGLARRGLPPYSPAVAHLDQIEQACRRAADLCRQLLAYAGRGQVAAVKTDLNQLVRASTALLGLPGATSATVRLDLADGLPLVTADAAPVRQVLVNLVMNAAEALGDTTGEVTIATQLLDIGPGTTPAGYHLAPPQGRYVRLAVSDTGPGIPPDVRARMFDPFFTTKFAGRGLGLAAVLGIMRTHHGAIRVTTDPGKGTTIEALWPVTATAPDERVATGKALVVDDEIYVREVTASTLQELGYEPLLAGDGLAALDVFRQNRNAVRVAVLDVVMPGMHGDQLLRELRALQPSLPVVLVSGLTDHRVVGANSGQHTEFVQKPFHPEELIAAVRRVMGAG